MATTCGSASPAQNPIFPWAMKLCTMLRQLL